MRDDNSFLWMVLTFLAALAFACIASADEFTDLVQKVEQLPAKKSYVTGCPCDGPCANCGCTHEGDCLRQKKTLRQPSKADFLHDCGCGTLPCNCFSGCHCSENRAENRQESRWVKDGGRWYLYRGNRCLGSVNGKGSYYRWLGDDYESEPCALPKPLPTEQSMPLPTEQSMPLPTEQSMLPVQVQICRT